MARTGANNDRGVRSNFAGNRFEAVKRVRDHVGRCRQGRIGPRLNGVLGEGDTIHARDHRLAIAGRLHCHHERDFAREPG